MRFYINKSSVIQSRYIFDVSSDLQLLRLSSRLSGKAIIKYIPTRLYVLRDPRLACGENIRHYVMHRTPAKKKKRKYKMSSLTVQSLLP